MHWQCDAAQRGWDAESLGEEAQASGEDLGGVQGGGRAGVVQRVKMSLEVSTVMLPEKWLKGLR